MAGITLLQKLQKLYGARAVTDRLGRTTNVQTTAQGTNNPFANTFSEKYLAKNPDGVEEAHNVIMENMQFAFGNKNAQQMKNFENNVNTLFEIKFPPAKAEAEILDLSTKKQVTGEGIDSLKNKMGLPEGVLPDSPMGKLLTSQNKLKKMSQELNDLGAKAYSAPEEGIRRSVMRQILLRDKRINLPENIRDSLDNFKDLQRGGDESMDPLALFMRYYKRDNDKLDKLDEISRESKDAIDAADNFLVKDDTIELLADDLGKKLKDYDGDPDAMAQGGIAGQLHLNEGGRVKFGDGGIKISPNINITKIGSTPYTGIDQSVTDRNYGVSGLLQLDNKYIGGNISKGNVKVEVQKDGNTVFNETLPKEKATQIYAGLGERFGNNLEVGTDMEGNFTFKIKSSFNQGGRVGFKKGGGMDRRTFLKLMGGLASIPVLGKFFKGAKVASKVVPLKGTTTTMPAWFPDLVDKFVAKGVGKKIDQDLMEYTTKDLPGVKLTKSDDGKIIVEGQNEYSRPYAIEYEPPGYEVIDEVKGKSVKTKGDFRATDVVPEGGGRPDDVPDFFPEQLDSVDDILSSDARIMEEFATGSKIKNPKRGEQVVGQAEVRAENAADDAAELAAMEAEDLATGGRVGMLAGGSVLKTIIKNLAKERGVDPSYLLKISNIKSLPKKVRDKLSPREIREFLEKRIEQTENFRDMMQSRVKFNQSIQQGKAIDDQGTGMSDIFDFMDQNFTKGSPVPRDVSEADVLQMEQMIKNMKTKGRKLNAKGGLAGQLL